MAAPRSGDDGGTPADADAVVRDPVEVVVEEYFAARRRGDSSDPGEFARRVPGHEAEFRELVAALGVLESAAAASERSAGKAAAVPERLGRYRLLRKIGRGGMGIVYEAVDDELGRHVALKVLPGYATLDERELARFRREAQSAARLNHPHIVPLFGVGEEDGTHWIAMQFIAGPSLAAARADGSARLPPHEVARHGLALADALAYAHAEGILHRDVKPSNVLLDRSGTIWITDFGLATSEGAEAITRTGETVGTPRYMAPEAFSGWADPRSDVWGVGVTLYELLAGRPAFDGSDRAQLLKQISDVEPPPLRTLDPALPRDLATIVHQCLQKEPSARYASARELADDLRRFLDGAPIRARPPSLADRAAFLVRRHRVAAIVAGAALVALVALVGAWAESLRRKNDRLAKEMTRAEENLVVASDAIERVLDEATADVVFRAPALDPLRRRVLEAALAFELRLLANQGQSAAKSFDVAMANLRVGAIDWGLQRLDESQAHYEAAATALRALDIENDGAAIDTLQLSAALAGIACCARDRGDLATAERSLREALAVIERALGGEPRSADHAFHLADATSLLADVLSREQKAADGAALLRTTLPRVTPWLERADASLPSSRVLLDAWVQLAECEQQAGAPASAVTSLRRALAVSRRLVAGEDPDVRDREQDAALRSWLGNLLHQHPQLGQAQEAGPLLSQARADLEAIAARWPMVPEFRRDLADALAREVVAAPASEPPSALEPRLLRAIELADGCLAERPNDASFLHAAVYARNCLTTLRDDAGDPEGAHAIALATTELIEGRGAALATWPPLSVEQADVAWYNRGVVEQELGQADAARAAFAKAAALARERPLRLRIGIATGSLHAATGSLDAGLAAWAAAVAEARPVDVVAEPDVAALFVQAQNLDANARMRSGDPGIAAGAASRLAEALAVATALVAAWPERADFAAALGMAHGDAGLLAHSRSDAAGARAELLLALPLLQHAVERDLRQAGWRHALAVVMDGLAGSIAAPADEAELATLAALLEQVAAAAAVAPADPGVQVEAARVFARAATIKHGEVATLMGAPARDPWADAAMERLRAASAAGFADAARMERDVAFESVKGRDDYRRWLADLTPPGR